MSELEDKISGILNDPDQMEKITQMAKSLMGGGAPADDKLGASLGDLFGGSQSGGSGGDDLPDMETIKRLGSLFAGSSGSGGGGQNKALLDAIRPYLAEKRREKFDRAVKLARMAKLAEIAFREQRRD